ncbi:possible integral membrane protein (plasmid) [Rhodococcus jostii RHA1]|nr:MULTISPECIES: DUF998 domain-containing protein [Rhodococcus]ABG99361.1 possible integral membrane protein [Rhodococcus jostii RHA1]QQZ18588.1 DUF998 domain-containing protein [Rhodococcus sp. 21391]
MSPRVAPGAAAAAGSDRQIWPCTDDRRVGARTGPCEQVRAFASGGVPQWARRRRGPRATAPVVPVWALLAAALSPVILVVTATAARWMQPPGYSPLGQTLSTLAAHGHGHAVMTAGFLAVACCYVVTAVGLRVLRMPARITLALAGLCGFVLTVFPPAPRAVPVHVAATAVGALLIAVWPILVISREPDAAAACRAPVAIAAAAVLLGLLGWLAGAAIDGWSLLGLAERVCVFAQPVWPLAVAITSRASSPHPGSAEE